MTLIVNTPSFMCGHIVYFKMCLGNFRFLFALLNVTILRLSLLQDLDSFIGVLCLASRNKDLSDSLAHVDKVGTSDQSLTLKQLIRVAVVCLNKHSVEEQVNVVVYLLLMHPLCNSLDVIED